MIARRGSAIRPSRIVSGSPDVDDGSDLAALRAAFDTWEAVEGADIAFREVRGDADITLAFTRRWPPEVGPFAAGVTFTQRGGGRIRSAEILFNNQHFQWATDGRLDRSDIQGVATHEIGHALGLDHSRTREATMYWSGGDVSLRDLDDDDRRGLRYLYGRGGEGRSCDTCTRHEDCAGEGLCVLLERDLGRGYCGAPCAGPGDCPEGFACYELEGGQNTCLPEELFCRDDGGSGLEEGDYCWGAAQCAAGLQCIPIPDGPAQCARDCRSDRDCARGQCVGAQGGRPGLCLTGGEAGMGDPCENSLDCASLMCVPLDEDLNVCTQACSPDRDDCPGGVPCVAVEDVPDIEGLCVPAGDVPEGGQCGDAARRCAAGLTCILEDEAARTGACRAACEPFGRCGGGETCTPFGGDQWFCLPAGDLEAGEDCRVADAGCAAGLICLPLDERGNGRCVRLCDDRRADGCGEGRACFDLDGGDGNLGVCPTGDGQPGDACTSGFDCATFRCVAHGEGGVCTRECRDDDGCPAGWTCEAFQGGRLCAPPDDGGAGGGPSGTGGGPSGAGGGPSGAGGGPSGAGGGPSGAGGGPSGAGGGPSGAGGGPSGAGGAGGPPADTDGGVTATDGGVTATDGGVPPVVERKGGGDGGCAVSPTAPAGAPLALALLALLVRRRR